MDGIPTPEGNSSGVAPVTVVSAVSGADGMPIASSTIPSVMAKFGTAMWSSPVEGGSVLVFGSKAPCHAHTDGMTL